MNRLDKRQQSRRNKHLTRRGQSALRVEHLEGRAMMAVVLPGLVGINDLTDTNNNGVDSNGGMIYGQNFSAIFRASTEAYFTPASGASTEAAFDLFDNKFGAAGGENKFCCNGLSTAPSPFTPGTGIWVEADFGQSRYVMNSFTIASDNDSGTDRDPDQWQILGSNDGVNFTPIFTYNSDGNSPFLLGGGSVDNKVIQYSVGGGDFASPAAYSIFRFNAYSSVNGALALSELEFFGAAAATPTATNDAGATSEDATTGGNVLGNDSSTSGPLAAAAGTYLSANGAIVTVAANGAYTYDPTNAPALQALAGGATLVDSFNYRAVDTRDSLIPGFIVKIYDVAGGNTTELDAAASPTNNSKNIRVVNGVTATSIVPLMDFTDDGAGVGATNHFATNNVPLGINNGADDNNYALLATGVMDVKSSGFYTFGTYADDGSYIKIDLNGNGVFTDPGETIVNTGGVCCADAFGNLNLNAGSYLIQLGYAEGGGGSGGEFFYSSGQKTAFDSGFKLIGDNTGGMDFGLPSSNGGTYFYNNNNPAVSSQMATLDAFVAAGSPATANQFKVSLLDVQDNNNPQNPNDYGVNTQPAGLNAGADDDNFGVVVQGKMTVVVPGTYFFGTSADDNSRIQILINGDWTTVAEFLGCCQNIYGPGNNGLGFNLPAGVYDYRAMFTDGNGGGGGEFFYNPTWVGTSGFQNNQTRLLGDPTGGIVLGTLPGGQGALGALPGMTRATGTVNITVNGVNDAPLAVPDRFTTNENTPLVAGPGGGFLSVATYTGVNGGTIAALDARLASNPTPNFFGTASVTDFMDDVNAAGVHYGYNLVPPGLFDNNNNDNYALVAGGFIHVNTPGTYTFGAWTDDANRIRIDLNQDGVFQPGETIINQGGGADRFSAGITLAAGDYKIDMAYVEGGGGSGGEFFYAPGTKTAFDSTFRIIGDPSAGISIYTGVLQNDRDVDNQPLSVTAGTITSANGATVTMNANGTFTYNPATSATIQALQTGQTINDTFTYTLKDNQLPTNGTATGTVTVVVTGISDPENDSGAAYTVAENAPLTVAAPGVLANDNGTTVSRVQGTPVPAGGSATVAATGGGTVTMNSDGSFTFNQGTAFDSLAVGQTAHPSFTYALAPVFVNRFNVATYKNAGANLASVDTRVQNYPPDAVGTVAVADFTDDNNGLGAGQHFAANNIPPGLADGADNNNYGLIAGGILRVSAAGAGTYTFGAYTDDDSRIRIDLNQNGVFEANETILSITGASNTDRFSNTNFPAGVLLAAGDYRVELAYSENTGGSGGEFFYAPGTVTSFAGNGFRVLGDNTGPLSFGTLSYPATVAPNVVSTGTFGTTAPTVSSTDLLNGIAGVLTAGTLNTAGSTSSATPVTLLTDGAFGAAGGDVNQTVAFNNNSTLQYNLDLAANPAGYTINTIQTYVGWADAGRINQDYIVEVMPVGSGAWQTLSYVDSPGNLDPSGANVATPPGVTAGSTVTAVTLSSQDGGPLATGVGAIRFHFLKQQNTYVGYREIDVNGVATAQTATVTLTVNGVNDVPTAPTIAPHATVNEGGTLALFGSGATDADSGDVLTYEWDLDNDLIFGESAANSAYGAETGQNVNFNAPFIAMPALSQPFPIALRVRDNHGGVSPVTNSTVTVNNVVPDVSITGPTEGVPGQLLNFTFDISHPTQAPPYTVSWSFGEPLHTGDDATPHSDTESVMASHAYSSVGTFTITVTVTDADGDSTTVTQDVDISTIVQDQDTGDVFIGGDNAAADRFVINPLADGGIEVVHTLNGHIERTRVFFDDFADPDAARIIVHGNGGADDIRVGSKMTRAVEFYGDAGADYLAGGSNNDSLFGGADNDRLLGGAGEDLMEGGGGNDSLDGGADNDTLYGGQGIDTVLGNNGNDFIFGGDGIDRNLNGGNDDDVIVGDGPNDSTNTVLPAPVQVANSLTGGNGNDILIGGTAADTLVAGYGNDILIGGMGADALNGGQNEDILISGTTDYDDATILRDEFGDIVYSDGLTSLLSIRQEWAYGDDDYLTRVDNVRNGGGLATDGGLDGMVHQDTSKDNLVGSSSLDWFWASLSSDKTDRVAGEKLN